MVSQNKHLSEILKIYKKYTDENVPVEVAMDLEAELKASRLLSPVLEDGDNLILDKVEKDDLTCLPLFTSTDELEGHGDSGVILTFAIDEYLDIIKEEGLDGIVINVESECIIFDTEFLEGLPEDAPLNVADNGEAFPASKLREIFETTEHDSFGDEEIFAQLSDAVMLNLVYSRDSLDDRLEDGILSADDVGEFRLCAVETERGNFVPIFTSKANLRKLVPDDGLFYYGQITRMSALIDFALANDLDGFVINPNGDEKIIPRKDLLSQARGIELIVEDSRFDAAQDYAFKI